MSTTHESMAMVALAQAAEQLDALTHVLSRLDGPDAVSIRVLLRPINDRLQQAHEALEMERA